MMKKLLFILVGVGLAIGLLGAAGYAYAQAGDPHSAETTDDDQPKLFLGRGHLLGFGGKDGILKDYLFPAIAKVFDLEDDQVQAFLKTQETMESIRDEYSMEEIQVMMQEAFSKALEDAVADGAITQEEADQILEHRQQMESKSHSLFPGRGGRVFIDRNLFDGIVGKKGCMPIGRPGFNERDGVLFEYMESALAAELDITIDELKEMKEDGFNLFDFADENGLTAAELQEMMKSVYITAVNDAMEEGAITQDQADEILGRLENFEGRLPFGPRTRNHGW